MENYYSSARVLTITLIVLAITCLYVSLTYFSQSLVLRKSRADFAWWFVFSQLEKDPQIYRDYEAKTAARKPIFLYAYFEPIGHCFAKEVGDKLDVEIYARISTCQRSSPHSTRRSPICRHGKSRSICGPTSRQRSQI